MATKKASRTNKKDEVAGLKRYVDQKGQWTSVTPASVKKRQAKEWKKLETLMKAKKK